ncbi:MAG: DUF4230 domain-containing protein [Ruminococcus sp.]|nr:DUF4230 domain-containing protein [Ruminococcus sp.]
MKKLSKKFKVRIVAIVLAGLLVMSSFAMIIPIMSVNDEPVKEIISVATLKDIINVSELSTFTAVYNGVAEVKNQENTAETDYYVSYEAKVKAGIDFEKIVFNVDSEQKRINVTMPEVYITDVNVDIATLDYIFVNDAANTSTVSQQAFKACEADVQAESQKQEKIYGLAEQNAKNILTALIRPIVEQLDEEYELVIE